MPYRLTSSGEEWLENYERGERIHFTTGNANKVLSYLILKAVDEDFLENPLDIARAARRRATSISGDTATWDIDYFIPTIRKLIPNQIEYYSLEAHEEPIRYVYEEGIPYRDPMEEFRIVQELNVDPEIIEQLNKERGRRAAENAWKDLGLEKDDSLRGKIGDDWYEISRDDW